MLTKSYMKIKFFFAVTFFLPGRVNTYLHPLLNTAEDSLATDSYFIVV